MHKHDFSKQFLEKSSGNPLVGFALFFMCCGTCPCLFGATYLGIFSYLLNTAYQMEAYYDG